MYIETTKRVECSVDYISQIVTPGWKFIHGPLCWLWFLQANKLTLILLNIYHVVRNVCLARKIGPLFWECFQSSSILRQFCPHDNIWKEVSCNHDFVITYCMLMSLNQCLFETCDFFDRCELQFTCSTKYLYPSKCKQVQSKKLILTIPTNKQIFDLTRYMAIVNTQEVLRSFLMMWVEREP